MSLIIGLTGGIGCGKTTVAAYFSKMGISVIDTDDLAKQAIEPGTNALIDVINHFGPDVLTPVGRLDRMKLRRRIFLDPKAKQWLEELLHPIILEKMRQRIQRCTKNYCVVAIPLLLETHSQNEVDRILVVDCPESTQIERTMARDNMTEAEVKNLMKTQVSREERLLAAHDIIENNLGLEDLSQQVKDLHHYYLSIMNA